MPGFRVAALALAVSVSAVPGGARAAALTRFTYVGATLEARTGNGIQGVTHVQFTLTGRRPPKGKCSRKLTLETLFDGMYSPKILMAHGYILSPHSRVTVCSDPVTDRLSEKLRVEMTQFSQGVLIASYTWISDDPKKGRSADTIESFENVEYHTSIATQQGHFSGRRVPNQAGTE